MNKVHWPRCAGKAKDTFLLVYIMVSGVVFMKPAELGYRLSIFTRPILLENNTEIGHSVLIIRS